MPRDVEINTGNRLTSEVVAPVDIPYIEIKLDDTKSVVIIGATPSQEYLEAQQRQTMGDYTCYRYSLGKRVLTSMGNTPLVDLGLEDLPDRNSCKTDEEWIKQALAFTTQAIESGTFQKGMEEGLWFKGSKANTLLLIPGFSHKLGGEPLPDMMAAFYDFHAVYPEGKDWPILKLI